MPYRRVEDRIAFDFTSIGVSSTIEISKIRDALNQLGFEIINDPLERLISYAQKLIGVTRFNREATIDDMPEEGKCGVFTQWLYGRIGIWIPPLAVQQSDVQTYDFMEIGGWDKIILRPGDLVFRRGRSKRFLGSPNWDVGHVGLVTVIDGKNDDGSIIHMTRERGVEEILLSRFTERHYRGACRVVRNYNWRDLVTLIIPSKLPDGWKIETSDDIRWRVTDKLCAPQL